MEYRTLGNSGLAVSRMALGTLTVGNHPQFAPMAGVGVDEFRRMLDIARDAGVNLVDTANMYSYGEAEEITGKALAGRRDEVVLTSKVRGKFQYQFNRLVEGRNPRFAEHAVALGDKDALFGGELTGIAVPGRSGRVEGVMVLLQPDEAQRSTMVAGKEKLLSEVDAKILEGVAAGESTVQLAAKLYLSRGGVEYHVTTLLRKLKVTNRPALVSKGYSMGILGVGQWPPRVLPEYVK